jgi:hypothetical protein
MREGALILVLIALVVLAAFLVTPAGRTGLEGWNRTLGGAWVYALVRRLTTSTEQCACATTACATLPITSRSRPVRP